MFDNWTFGRKVGAGFALAGLVLLIIAAVGYQSTVKLLENDRWVEHTHEVRRELALLLAEITEAETGQRGFVISADEAFLQPYESARTQVPQTLERVRSLTLDNARQQRRIAQLKPFVDSKVGLLAQAIERTRAGGAMAGAKIVAEGGGRLAMDEIRRLIREMDDDEAQLLVLRAADAEASGSAAKSIMIWGSLIGVVIVAFVGWFIANALTQQVGTAVHLVQSSSTELQAAANQQASGAKEQATAMSEITTTISELLATSRQIADSSQRVAQIAEQTAVAARGGDHTVERAHESILAIRRQVDSVVSHMLELGRKSQQIGSVLDIVSELAEQTNILAINATIEAAGAGDAGKRFAVVADEIRKLADRVTGSTKEIRGLIDDVRSAVNTTVMATETGSKAVDAGSKQFGEVASSFRAIVGSVSTTTEAAREIELSTKQQSTAVEQVNVAIANVAQATREMETSAEQTLKTATQLSTLSMDLMRIVQPQMNG